MGESTYSIRANGNSSRKGGVNDTVSGDSRYVACQMAEVAIPRTLFAEILRLIAELRPPPTVAPA